MANQPSALVGHEFHGDGHSSHEIPFGTLVVTLLLLMVLMGVTIAASYWEAPGGLWVNNVIALGIATIKAVLVIWIFMAVKHQSVLTKVWVVAGFLVLALLFGILGDYWTRKFEPVGGWEKIGESATPREFAPVDGVRPPNNINLRPRG